MSIFNQRLNKILNEWMEPAIDHHLDNGVGAHSYQEILDAMVGHYGELIPALIGRIDKYLSHIGFQGDGGSDRQPEEQQQLLVFQQVGVQLNRLQQVLARLSREFKDIHVTPNDEDDQEHTQQTEYMRFNWKRSQQIVQNTIGQLYRSLSGIQQSMASRALKPDPQLFNEIKSTVEELVGDFQKINHFFSSGAQPDGSMPSSLTQGEGNFTAAPPETGRQPRLLRPDNRGGLIQQLLTTPEATWIPNMDQNDLHQIVLQHPDHGVKEAVAKISTIVAYGPEHRQSGAGLRMLVDNWHVTAKDLLDNIPNWMDEEGQEQFRQWIQDEGPEYGIQ